MVASVPDATSPFESYVIFVFVAPIMAAFASVLSASASKTAFCDGAIAVTPSAIAREVIDSFYSRANGFKLNGSSYFYHLIDLSFI